MQCFLQSEVPDEDFICPSSIKGQRLSSQNKPEGTDQDETKTDVTVGPLFNIHASWFSVNGRRRFALEQHVFQSPQLRKLFAYAN